MMPSKRSLPSLLLFTSALVAPGVATAQGGGQTAGQSGGATPTGGTTGGQATGQAEPSSAGTPAGQTPPQSGGDAPANVPGAPDDPAASEQVEVSAPGSTGAEVVVTGQRDRNVARTGAQVVSVLSSADIARTGEGDIAGALGRVTGLSVVGNGFVYVRGLGDRYSLALLNGSPLPSPEPLRRVVPLDIFPTNIVASSLVQKSYSVNYPGEFGGGVINLTTKTAPSESFLSVGVSGGGDSETTGLLGYTYYGTGTDWSGFGNGGRKLKPGLRRFLASGNTIAQLSSADNSAIAAELVNGRNSVVQRNGDIPANFSSSATGGVSFDALGATVGVIATAGYSSRWRTRDTLQQTANTNDLSSRELDFRRVITDNRVVVNGLIGLNATFGDNKVRLTNVYIRDTLKQARLGQGTQASGNPTATLLQQDTAWFARQLYDLQLVGEFRLTPELSFEARGGYANTRRNAPDEFSYQYYYRSNARVCGTVATPGCDPYGATFINTLTNGQTGLADVSYSFLNEDLWSAGADLSYRLTPGITATVGYAYSDTSRRNERRSFLFRSSNLPLGLSVLRPDILLSQPVITAGPQLPAAQRYTITLTDNEPNPVFRSTLNNHAGYAKLVATFLTDFTLDAGVRYETATERVNAVQVFTTPTSAVVTPTNLQRDYWLPAATLTYALADRMQLRLSASKTIARPQFRELVFQTFYDPETNRNFRGNPLLVDSQLYNGEARYEWYFAREQRLSLAGFYKRIDNPIETFASFDDNSVVSSFANAPRATLYGGEVELVKYFNLDEMFGDAFGTRRFVTIANYTYIKSRLKVRDADRTAVFSFSSTRALDFFRDGVPLTGQSDHLVNLQFGLEDRNRLSQQTLLLTYASDRVTNRGAGAQPDIVERPGLRLDFVAREGVKFYGLDTELKLEVRNITGTRYQEFQEAGANRVYYNRYDVGTSISLGLSVDF